MYLRIDMRQCAYGYICGLRPEVWKYYMYTYIHVQNYAWLFKHITNFLVIKLSSGIEAKWSWVHINLSLMMINVFYRVIIIASWIWYDYYMCIHNRDRQLTGFTWYHVLLVTIVMRSNNQHYRNKFCNV